MNLSRLYKGVKSYCKQIISKPAFVKGLFKAAGNSFISDSYAKQLYSGGRPFTDVVGVIADFGIPEKADCNKKARCVALTRQMQKLFNGKDEADDILAMNMKLRRQILVKK